MSSDQETPDTEFPRIYRLKGGNHYKFLTSPETIVIGHGPGAETRRIGPLVAFFDASGRFVIRPDGITVPGGKSYKARQVRELLEKTRGFQRGEFLDVTDNDPFDPGQRDRRVRKAQTIKEANFEGELLEARLAELEAKRELEKLRPPGRPAKVKEDARMARLNDLAKQIDDMNDKLKAVEDSRFQCPWCQKRFVKGSHATRKAGWLKHVQTCARMPSDDGEAQAIIRRTVNVSRLAPPRPVFQGEPLDVDADRPPDEGKARDHNITPALGVGAG